MWGEDKEAQEHLRPGWPLPTSNTSSAMKRAYSQTQGSPPPSNIFQSAPAAGKAKKPRASGSHANTPLASSPPYYAADSPRGRSRSRSRSRSLSVVPGQGGGHKGKEREGSVVPPAGEGGEEGGEDVDGEDEELDYSDDEVRCFLCLRGDTEADQATTVWVEPEGEREAEGGPSSAAGAL